MHGTDYIHNVKTLESLIDMGHSGVDVVVTFIRSKATGRRRPYSGDVHSKRSKMSALMVVTGPAMATKTAVLYASSGWAPLALASDFVRQMAWLWRDAMRWLADTPATERLLVLQPTLVVGAS